MEKVTMSSADRPEDTGKKQSIEEVAAAYLEEVSRDQKQDDQLVELRSEVAEQEALREEFADRHGEESQFVQRIDRSIGDLQADIEAEEAEQQQQDRLKEALLEQFTEFELAEPWVTSTVIRAFTHALTGQEREALIVNRTVINTPDDVAEIEETERWRIEDEIICLAMEECGDAIHTEEMWEWMKEYKYDREFAVVVVEDSADKDRVAECLEQETKETKNRLERPIYKRDRFIPYHREKGQFMLSTVGEYFAAKYGPFEVGAGSENDESEDEGGDGGDGQMSFEDMD